MQGISSQALQFGKYNRYKYNGIEFDSTFGLDNYEAEYRNLDPQTGRWWQIDPKCEMSINPAVEAMTEDQEYEEGLESISPYASMNNDPVKYKDPKGDAPCDPCLTAPIEEWVNNTADAEPSASIEVHIGGAAVIGLAMLWDAISSSDAPIGNGSMTGIPSSNQTSALHTNMSTPAPAKLETPKAVEAVANPAKNQVQAKSDQTKMAPGQTAAGHPTDVHGNKLGPSGKPQVNNVNHPSQKAAKDAARNEGNGAPVKHPSPTKGGPHYHPTKDGEKIPNSTHHEY